MTDGVETENHCKINVETVAVDKTEAWRLTTKPEGMIFVLLCAFIFLDKLMHMI